MRIYAKNNIACKQYYFFIYQKIMSLFEKILEIKTWRNDLVMKAVYVQNANATGRWSYFIYHYDLLNHTFYINDLDSPCDNWRTSAINIIEHIVNAAYRQEMNALNVIVRKIQTSKKPNIICIYKQGMTWNVIIDKVSLEEVKWRDESIISFKNPKWDKNLDNTLEVLGLRSS